MKKIARVDGPYMSQSVPHQPRRFVNIRYEDGTRTTKSYARYLMEQHLGRTLTDEEEVDHRDDDRLNDSIENLQILSRQENIAKSRKIEWIEFPCPVCLAPTKKRAHKVRHNRKQGKAGPFCGKSCARRHQLAPAGAA